MSVTVKIILMSLVLISMSGMMACQHLNVVPIQNDDHVVLDELDIVVIMRKAGFDDDQILEIGTDVRNGLAQHGGVQLKAKDYTQAIYAVKYPYIHATSRLRGNFIYNLETGDME